MISIFSKKNVYFYTFVALFVCGAMAIQVYAGQILLKEDFEGLALGPFQNEKLTVISTLNPQKVWTSTPPTGWTVDNSIMPEPPGVRDWHGWTFANAQAWAYVAGNQRRAEFTNAKGVVAIADSDEWDDIKPHGEGLYETYLKTPAISLTGVSANSLTMTFDSCWRPEGGQEVNIMASFDGGAPQEVLWWNSIAGDANFHSDESTNELVSVTINNPAGAKTMVLTWGYMYGSNNWFWAVDNIKITSGNQVVFSEDFESLALGPFLDEKLPDNVQTIDVNKVWTKTPPTGWTLDDSLMPAGGVLDWRGWAFANAQAWATVAEDQRRSEFTKAKGVCAIADPDEYDDMSHDPGTWEGYLSTPAISLTGIDPNSVILTFDSSWRPEAPQEAGIQVSYDGKDPEWILYWTSVEGDPDFHSDDSTNETVTVEIQNPAGVKSMVLTWGLFYAGNNWFWAFDNVLVSSGTITGIDNWSLF